MIALVLLSLGAATPPVLTLDDALRTAATHLPQLLQARAQTEMARAAADIARAPMLPHINGSASYARATGNFAPAAGSLPSTVASGGQTATGTSLNTFNKWSFSVTASQFLYDFGETLNHWRSMRLAADSQEATELATQDLMVLNVRTAFFSARAMKALVGVALDARDNQKRHLDQTQGFVEAGRDAPIALAQARTNYANAKVALVTADNNYLIAKAQLNQAMGVEQATDYDVADETQGPVDGEGQDVDSLAAEGKKARPDVIALARQVTSQALQLRSSWDMYAPALSAQMNLNDGGTDITNLVWNWSASIVLSVPVFDGLQTWATVKQQRALLTYNEAQLEQQKQQVRLDVEQARLAVRAAKENISGTEEALVNAREQLRLAQDRYTVGVGNMIELADAQSAFTAAQGQKVQAEYNLAAARAQLIKALGRR